MGFTSKSPVTVDRSHKRDSFVEVRDAANLFELALEDENVGEVDGFPQRDGRHENVDEAK